ncbi:hypothetical protein K438DRAFT_211732 [Mycena galopus ATCC 62051]|nr:hypothetical protein K438DRAFT_211732 [Mycena galopus ATCC 62051]
MQHRRQAQTPRTRRWMPTIFLLDDSCCLFDVFQHRGGYLRWVNRMRKICSSPATDLTG